MNVHNIIIDGSQGEGGGQILRSSLALSIVTGRPFRVENIRARRAKPGLLRQHLTAVNAAREICDGHVEGAEMGSTSLTFVPGKVRAGDYRFAVGTAGSAMLVLQTILIPLLCANGTTTLVVEGGTHNPAAPPYDFIEAAFLPLLRRAGANLEATLEQYGFYPAGGGRARFTIHGPTEWRELRVEDAGEIVSRLARAVVSNLPFSIAQREIEVIREKTSWSDEALQAHTVKGSIGPGNALTVTLKQTNVTEVFTGFGEKGVRAEDVADHVVSAMRRYLASGAAVGEFLADQLLLPMAFGGGGSFTACALSSHAATNIEVIRRFTEREIAVEERADHIHVAVSAD